MNKSVLIQCDDQGQYSVGEQPMPGAAVEGAPEGQAPAMQPAKDLEDALGQARSLFAAGAEGEQPTEQQAEDQFTQGFAGARGV